MRTEIYTETRKELERTCMQRELLSIDKVLQFISRSKLQELITSTELHGHTL